jgi:hypothetical protein
MRNRINYAPQSALQHAELIKSNVNVLNIGIQRLIICFKNVLSAYSAPSAVRQND